jgi:hypothetical protein
MADVTNCSGAMGTAPHAWLRVGVVLDAKRNRFYAFGGVVFAWEELYE